MTDQNESAKVRINVTIVGQPAEFLKELRRRGLAVSNHDSVIQGLLVLQERILNHDLKKAELEKAQAAE